MKTNAKVAICGGLAVIFFLLNGCSANSRSDRAGHGNSTGAQIVAISEQLIGTPYRYGGESPNGFDCSGLVRYVYRKVGIQVPHSAKLLEQKSRKVDLDEIEPGDLLFFHISRTKISHVGIYAADGKFIHAPSSGKSVSLAKLDNSYWKEKLVSAGRFY